VSVSFSKFPSQTFSINILPLGQSQLSHACEQEGKLHFLTFQLQIPRGFNNLNCYTCNDLGCSKKCLHNTSVSRRVTVSQENPLIFFFLVRISNHSGETNLLYCMYWRHLLNFPPFLLQFYILVAAGSTSLFEALSLFNSHNFLHELEGKD
jgi:hypothetical protein